MAKVTLGELVIEGTIEELKQLGVKIPVEESENEPLKVGDYVKVLASDNGYAEKGDIAEIIEDDGSEAPYRLELIGGKDGGWQDIQTVVKATDEEVAEAKRKLAEAEIEAKWAKIGREPNEYKEGDIVRVIEPVIYEKGTIGIITEVKSRESFRVEANSRSNVNWHGYERVELLTPVEARFDQ